MTNCQYIGKCSSEGICCNHCENNPDLKEDHYIPKRRYIPYIPYVPYVPFQPSPFKPYWKCEGSQSLGKQDYFQQL